MAIDKELINLGLNIDQTNKIKKLNKKFTQGIDQLDKSNKEGHKTSQAMIAAVGVKLHKQNAALANGMEKVNNMVAKNNALLEQIEGDLKGIDEGMKEINAITQDTNRRARARDNKEEIQDAVKQFIYEACLEVENIKKNSNAAEKFVMYLAISESIKMNSNIKVEIINTIQGKKEFKAVMDSIENGMNDSFEMISEIDLEELRKFHKSNEKLNSLLLEYNNTEDELDIKITGKKEIEDNILKEKEQIERNVLKTSEQLKAELEKNRRFTKRIQRLFLFALTLGISAIINRSRNNAKKRKIKSITEKGNKDLESTTEKGNKELNQIKPEITLLVEKLKKIIPENLINEFEAMEKTISKKYKNVENYMPFDFFASAISTHEKK